MNYEELEVLRKRIENAESDVVYAAKDLLTFWRHCEEQHLYFQNFELGKLFDGLSVKIDDLMKVYEELPPADTKVEL